MSDMRDPRLDPSQPDDPNPRRDYEPRAAYDTDRMSWSWILGGIAALAIVLLALSYWSGTDTRTAGDTRPPATTGQSSPQSSPMSPPATTGQGPARTAPPANSGQ
jgi:hypothetical protein